MAAIDQELMDAFIDVVKLDTGAGGLGTAELLGAQAERVYMGRGLKRSTPFVEVQWSGRPIQAQRVDTSANVLSQGSVVFIIGALIDDALGIDGAEGEIHTVAERIRTHLQGKVLVMDTHTMSVLEQPSIGSVSVEGKMMLRGLEFTNVVIRRGD